jgi:hypothetical protein
VIRPDLTLVPNPLANLGEVVPAPLRRSARTSRTSAKAPETQAFPPPAAVPSWARASGRAGQGDPLFAAGAALALLDVFLRADPPAAGALRSRLALQSAAASAKILRPTPTKPRCATCASLLGTRSALRRICSGCGATSPAARPASTPAGFSTQLRGWIWPWTRTASRPA